MRKRVSALAAAAEPTPSKDEARQLTPPPGITFEATIDGSRMRVGARDEVVIACGKASITLRRNGRVIIRGTHVETNSTGTNRIKGGHVRVN
jgi:hypothetical protein